ncbi:MAG: TonB-dependent receptor plug domain-containing protein [Marinilabiliales bacterium]|nr:TonB-dependent receptor plug domain-containing protein [Marinilabiliales bacterium]
MDEVVVSAQRAPVAFSQTARIVQIIRKEEISQAPLHDLQDLLKFVSGLDIRQRGNNGVQSDLAIRGSSFDQVLILLNGIPFNDPQTGHHNLNLPISLDAIDRIEILEGAASRIFGPNAFGGAINILTQPENGQNLKARISSGQNQFLEAAANSNFTFGNVSNRLSVDYKKSNGASQNTDFEIRSAFYHGQWRFDGGRVELQGGASDRGYGANDFYTPVYPSQYERVNNSFASFKVISDGFLHLNSTFYWRRNQDRFELFRDGTNTPSWYKDHNYHLTDTYGSSLNSWISTSIGKFDVGFDLRNENIWSTVLGRALDKPMDIPGESGKYFTLGDNRTNFSLTGEYTANLGNLMLSAGFLANHNTYMGRKWSLYPGLDAALMMTKSLKLYTSVNSSLRIPTFTDL